MPAEQEAKKYLYAQFPEHQKNCLDMNWIIAEEVHITMLPTFQ